MRTTTMRGKNLDMGKLKSENANKVAIGNAGLNARGDKVTPGGHVLQTREQIMTDYNVSNPKAVRQVGLNNIRNELTVTPADAAAALRKQQQDAKASKRRIVDSEN